ncbi:MAG: hypothetical protein ABJA98_22840 [Acidobacteriota bacterium]
MVAPRQVNDVMWFSSALLLFSTEEYSMISSDSVWRPIVGLFDPAVV